MTVRKNANGTWTAISKTTGRPFGTYGSKAEAVKRTVQMEAFKSMNKEGTVYKNVKKGKK